jgi:hypothetical protein
MGTADDIWRNFFRFLEEKNEGDTQDLFQNVYKLDKLNIEDRQIRNVAMMAQYLAKFKKQTLIYEHMKDAVDSMLKFNTISKMLRWS